MISQPEKDRLLTLTTQLQNEIILLPVEPPPPPLPITLNATAIPDTIERGKSSILTWNTLNATSVLLNDTSISLNGFMSVSPLVTTIYVFKALNAAEVVMVTVSLTVTVIPPLPPMPPIPPMPPPPPPPPPSGDITLVVSASPATIIQGKTSTLSWTSTGVEPWRVHFLDAINYTEYSVGNYTSRVVKPNVTTTYIFKIFNKINACVIMVPVTVTVNPLIPIPPPPTPIGPITLNVSISPDNILQGETATLTWQSTNAISVQLDGSPVPLNGTKIVKPAATTIYKFKALNKDIIDDNTIMIRAAAPINVTPVAKPLPFNPIGTSFFIMKEVPLDGFKETIQTYGRVHPALKQGQRLNGIVTIVLENAYLYPNKLDSILGKYRLLVDGIPQPTTTIDTTKWIDGTHVIAFQYTDVVGLPYASNGSINVVFNNSNKPLTTLENQAIVTIGESYAPNSIAWGCVNVVWPPKAYPLDPELSKHPIATTNIDRQRLAKEQIWWCEGLNHQGTPLFRHLPIPMKNKQGDYFVKQYNPKFSSVSLNAFSMVSIAPAYDGPRGIGNVSPYTTFVPSPAILSSGQTGWLGVDIAGRVVRMDITGEIQTILGPRSVTGVIGTDSNELSITLDMRITNGEKEYIGDNGGIPLNVSQDIWTCNLFPFEGVIADTGNNRVVEIQFDKAKLMRSWHIPNVTSVWASTELQQAGNAWFAVNPNGLWRMTVIIGPDGIPQRHSKIEQIANIPNAAWVRGDKTRIYILTFDLGIYEYIIATEEVIERKPRENYNEAFVFMTVDENGSCGPQGRIYFGSVVMNKTQMLWIDPNDWIVNSIKPDLLLINRIGNNNWQASNDAFGHYLWGFAVHTTLPKMIATGVSNTSWFMWTGCLGDKPIIDLPISQNGRDEFRMGKLDKYPALASIFGFYGHGMIGYSCDEWKDYKTFEEARIPMRTALDPLFPTEMLEIDKENVTKQLFAQRTRKHFQ